MSGGEEDGGGDRFADLIGDTKPIDRGPERVAPTPTGRPKRPRKESARRGARFRWPDPTERLRAAAEGVSNLELLALGRGEPAPQERIDLHGLRREAARRVVEVRIESARARGLRCLIVIHGRGQRSAADEPILRNALPAWLSEPPTSAHVLAFAPAPQRLGGNGATLVLLRRA